MQAARVAAVVSTVWFLQAVCKIHVLKILSFNHTICSTTYLFSLQVIRAGSNSLNSNTRHTHVQSSLLAVHSSI